MFVFREARLLPDATQSLYVRPRRSNIEEIRYCSAICRRSHVSVFGVAGGTRARRKHLMVGKDTRPDTTHSAAPHAHNPTSATALPPTHRVHLHLQQGVLPNEVLYCVRELQRVQQGEPRHRGLDVVLAPPDHKCSSEDGHCRAHELDAYVEPPDGIGSAGFKGLAKKRQG